MLDPTDQQSLLQSNQDVSMKSVQSRGRGRPKIPNHWTRVVNAYEDGDSDIEITDIAKDLDELKVQRDDLIV